MPNWALSPPQASHGLGSRPCCSGQYCAMYLHEERQSAKLLIVSTAVAVHSTVSDQHEGRLTSLVDEPEDDVSTIPMPPKQLVNYCIHARTERAGQKEVQCHGIAAFAQFAVMVAICAARKISNQVRNLQKRSMT